MANRSRRKPEAALGCRRGFRWPLQSPLGWSLGVVALCGGTLSVGCSVWAQASSQASSRPRAQAQSLPDAPSALLQASAVAPPDTPIESGAWEQNAPQATAAPVPTPAPTPAPTMSSATAPTASPAAAPAAPQNPAKPSTSTDAAHQAASAVLPRCPRQGWSGTLLLLPGKDYAPCQEQNPLQFIIDAGPVSPLTPTQKGVLAIRGVLDPFNLITIAGFSGITIAANSHTAYGPGFKGFARLSGYSMVGDIQGEFLGTFAIPVLTHEDPRYHRLPGKRFSRRLEHAIVHTYVTQHDNGSLMPNYSVLLGYPISAEIANLYVPGLQTNGAATAERIAVGIGTDPVGALIAEFLPDVARHIHIHVIFMQQILNQVATGSSGTPP